MVNLKFGLFFDKSCFQHPMDMRTFSAHYLLWLQSSGGHKDLFTPLLWPQEPASLHRGQLWFSLCLRHHEVYSWPQENQVVQRKRGLPYPAEGPAQGRDTKETTINIAAKRLYFKYSAVNLYRQIPKSRSVLFIHQDMQEGRWKWKDTCGLLQ